MHRFGNIYISDDDDEEEEVNEKKAGTDPFMEKMLKTRNILISGEIRKDLAERVIRQLLLLDDMGKEDIYIFIDSPGGDADAGYAIFDMIRFVEAPVWTIGMGLVASAAAIIQLACPKNRRVGLPNSHYLIHQPSSGIRGVATDIEIYARELDKVREKINRLIAEETSLPFEQVEKDTDRDYWMNAEDAVAYGLISKVIQKHNEIKTVVEKKKPNARNPREKIPQDKSPRGRKPKEISSKEKNPKDKGQKDFSPKAPRSSKKRGGS
jgi:ATP-dependent Clp protease protease subunit